MSVETSASKSRRALLVGAIGGLTGLLAGRLGSPDRAVAAAGDPLILGIGSNDSGTAGTTVAATTAGTALYVFQKGTGTGIRSNAVGANSIAGSFTATNGTGISGVTATAWKSGVYAGNDSPVNGGGSAVRAHGQQNDGLFATTSQVGAVAVRARNTDPSPTAVTIEGTIASGTAMFAKSDTGVGVQGYSPIGDGVLGTSGNGIGVRGVAKTGCGIQAESETGPDGVYGPPLKIVPCPRPTASVSVGAVYVDDAGEMHIWNGTAWRTVVTS